MLPGTSSAAFNKAFLGSSPVLDCYFTPTLSLTPPADPGSFIAGLVGLSCQVKSLTACVRWKENLASFPR